VRRNLAANRPDVTAFAAAKPLARLGLSLRHGGCGKQNLG
jgi:hypothetical protein